MPERIGKEGASRATVGDDSLSDKDGDPILHNGVDIRHGAKFHGTVTNADPLTPRSVPHAESSLRQSVSCAAPCVRSGVVERVQLKIVAGQHRLDHHSDG